jgi:hypothetical protein
MTGRAQGGTAVLAFAPHSGWAAVVALGGGAANPEVLVRGRVEMAEPRLAGSKQPYHAVEGLPVPEAERRLSRFSEAARRNASHGIGAVVADLGSRGRIPRVAGILESAGRKGANLAAILASHALIHTADGDHFREALARASEGLGLRVTRVRQRDLVGRATTLLGRSEGELAAAVLALGKRLGPPWGADQKSAALLAWMLLASR